MFPVFAPLSRLIFNLCSFFLLLLLSLNRIAYRRVICVYQYQVADDLSGRSSSFKPHFIFLYQALLPGAVWPHALQFKNTTLDLVCSVPSCCTNIHPVLKLKAPGCSQLTGWLSASCVDLRDGNCKYTSIHYTYAHISNNTHVIFWATFSEWLCLFQHVCSDFTPLVVTENWLFTFIKH